MLNEKSFSLAVLSLDGKHEKLNCKLPHECLLIKAKGWGYARSVALKAAKYDFIIMVNGDVSPKPELYEYLLNHCERNCFFMTNYNGGACSRILAGYVSSLEKIGFDKSLKYIFEDGDFYVRALSEGLTFKVIPNSLFVHHEHYHDFLYNPHVSFFVDWEFSRVFAKHKRYVRLDLYNFFLQPLCAKRVPNMVARLFMTIYWIIRGKIY